MALNKCAKPVAPQRKASAIGYCIGGTLTAASLGWMAAQNDARVNAATFFTTQVDFEKAGDLLVYVDEEQVKWIEGRMKEKGYLPGTRMADAFNLLRDHLIAHHLGLRQIKDQRLAAVVEVRRHQRIVVDGQHVLHRAVSSRGHQAVDFILGGRAVGGEGQVDQRHIDGRNAQGETVKLAF